MSKFLLIMATTEEEATKLADRAKHGHYSLVRIPSYRDKTTRRGGWFTNVIDALWEVVNKARFEK